jgi:hypothetical protein
MKWQGPKAKTHVASNSPRFPGQTIAKLPGLLPYQDEFLRQVRAPRVVYKTRAVGFTGSAPTIVLHLVRQLPLTTPELAGSP